MTAIVTDPREPLGRVVRETWVDWAREQPDPKPSWLTPWDQLDAGQREVDMRIGAAVAAVVLAQLVSRTGLALEEAIEIAIGDVGGIVAWRTAPRDEFARRVIISTAVRAAAPIIEAAARKQDTQ